MKPAAAWAATAGYMGILFFLSHQARLPVPPGIPDVALHAPAWAVLGWLVTTALRATLPGAALWLLASWAAAVALGYGVLDEIHQSFVPGRDASMHDVAADAAGAAAGIAACLVVGRFLRATKEG